MDHRITESTIEGHGTSECIAFSSAGVGQFAERHLAVQKHGPFDVANPALYAAQSSSYDITTADLAKYPGTVRVDYNNGVDDSDGYLYTARSFDDMAFVWSSIDGPAVG